MSPVIPLEAEHRRRYSNRFLTPERYDEHPPSIYVGSETVESAIVA